MCSREKVCCGTLQEVYSGYTLRRVLSCVLTGRENATTLKKILDDDQGSRILSFMFSRSVLLDNPELVVLQELLHRLPLA